jgi:salicylate hydroxylase
VKIIDEVIVVGGGLGGLSSALALGQQGRSVKLLEQSAEIAPIGYGVQIGPNVLPILSAMGVGAEVRQCAYLPDHLHLLDAYTGETIFRIDLKGEEFSHHFDSPYIAIHRVDLHEILLKACRALPTIDLNQATHVTGFSQGPQHITVHSSNKPDIAGSALIAADGLRSVLRAQLHPEDTSVPIGYAANRTIVAAADAPAVMRQERGVAMWTGENFHVIYYPLRGGTEINIVGVFELPPGLDPDDSDSYVAHVRASIVHAHPAVHDVVSVLNLRRRWSIADRRPTRKWAEGRMTLLGDAAHATLQSLAQGAGMSIEDSAVLAQEMAAHPTDPALAFKSFERKRLLRTSRVVLESRALWPRYHCGGIDAEVRNAQWQEMRNPDFYRCLKWLWRPIIN